MRLLCPTCGEPLDDVRVCRTGHRFETRNGVLSLLEPDFARRLDEFTRALSRVREAQGRRLTDPTAFEQLPFGDRTRGNFQWRLRQYDLAVLERLIDPRRQRTVLDVGAWNGWLSHRLARRGFEVTAIDYFVDPFDGLEARRFYSTAWQAIQMNIADLRVLDGAFDVVVLNRCVQFAPDPRRFVADALAGVVPGGFLVLTGMEIFRDPSAKARRVEAELQEHRQRHGFDLFFAPTKGYLDGGDQAAIESLGVRFRPYPQLRIENLRARLSPTRPRHYFGVVRSIANGAVSLDGVADLL